MDYYNLDIYHGEDFSLGVVIKDDEGLPMNLAGYGIRGVIKTRYSSLSGVNIETSLDAPLSGIATLSLTSTQTLELPIGQLIYDVEAYPTGSNAPSFKILRGYVNVYPEITN